MHLPFNLNKNYDINFKLLAILPGNWDIFITATEKRHPLFHQFKNHMLSWDGNEGAD